MYRVMSVVRPLIEKRGSPLGEGHERRQVEGMEYERMGLSFCMTHRNPRWATRSDPLIPDRALQTVSAVPTSSPRIHKHCAARPYPFVLLYHFLLSLLFPLFFCRLIRCSLLLTKNNNNNKISPHLFDCSLRFCLIHNVFFHALDKKSLDITVFQVSDMKSVLINEARQELIIEVTRMN